MVLERYISDIHLNLAKEIISGLKLTRFLNIDKNINSEGVVYIV